jgi:hypothetical protein
MRKKGVPIRSKERDRSNDGYLGEGIVPVGVLLSAAKDRF